MNSKKIALGVVVSAVAAAPVLAAHGGGGGSSTHVTVPSHPILVGTLCDYTDNDGFSSGYFSRFVQHNGVVSAWQGGGATADENVTGLRFQVPNFPMSSFQLELQSTETALDEAYFEWIIQTPSGFISEYMGLYQIGSGTTPISSSSTGHGSSAGTVYTYLGSGDPGAVSGNRFNTIYFFDFGGHYANCHSSSFQDTISHVTVDGASAVADLHSTPAFDCQMTDYYGTNVGC